MRPPHAGLLGAVGLASAIALGSFGQVRAAEPVKGIYALPDNAPKVTATLVATDAGGALKQTFDIAMTPIGSTSPETAYETELSKELHVIAVSQDLRAFVHEHGEAPGADGHFRIPVALPKQGLWHVYADGVPKGLGQQVMRFDLTVGTAPSGKPPALPKPTGLRGMDGRYGVRFDAIALKADQETQLGLHLLRDGKAAADITPFLGVAAHAVFIDATDLTYVHAHAAPAQVPAAGGTGAGMQRDMTGMASMPGMPAMGSAAEAKAIPGMPASEATDMPGMEGMEGMGAPLPANSAVPPDLTLHIKAPKAGTYMLWVQFDGGGQVRTVPFVVSVT